MLRAILLAATLFATTAQAEEYCEATGGTAPIPEAVIGMEYRHIAKIMDDHGWTPIPQDHSNGFAYAEEWTVEAGYVEMEACSGSGAGYCAFMWGDEVGNDIRITTALNYPISKDGIRHDKVVAIRLFCRDTDRALTYVFR